MAQDDYLVSVWNICILLNEHLSHLSVDANSDKQFGICGIFRSLSQDLHQDSG